MCVKIETFTLSRNDAFMEGWPDLIRLQSGRILVVYNECTAHTNRDGTHITMRKSDDEGQTWSEKQYIGEETQHGDQWNSIRVNQLKNGTIVLVCDRICGRETTSETRFFAFQSTDDGETWSEARDIGVRGFCSDKVRELSDGSLLLCVSRHNVETGKAEVLAHKSYNGGRTWSAGVMAARSDVYTFIEPAAIELKNGTVAVFLRENTQCGYNGFAVYSDDKGETFYGLREIPVRGMHRPCIGRLANGTLLLSYREYASYDVYPDLKMCLLTEENVLYPETWSPVFHLVDHDRAEQADQGYSAWVQLPDSTVLMVNYITDKAPKPFIRGYRIKGAGLC